MTPAGILSAYRCVFSVLIVAASVQTLLAEPLHHALLIASVEIAGAVLLLWRRAQWIGATLLLLVFASAQVMAAAAGNYPTRFLQYAFSTLLIVMLDAVLERPSPLPPAPAR
jgi:hypothetical protein